MYRFVNFKGFAAATLDLDRAPVTILIGRNGSGKSNALEAITLLAGLLGGHALTEVSDLGAGGKLQVRGGLRGCVRNNKEEFSLGFGWAGDLEYELTIRVPREVGARPGVTHERLAGAAKVLFESAKRGPELLRVKFEGKDRVKAKQVNLPDYAPTIARLPLMPNQTLSDQLAEASEVLLQAASRVFAFDPVPRSMRAFVEQHDTSLHPTGANLAAVLYGLSRGDADQQASLVRITECIRHLPEEPVKAIKFIAVKETSQVTLGLLAPSLVFVPAQLMSDGTLRALAIITAVETAPKGSLVLVEEFDNGLHPSRTNMLMDFCWRRAKEREIRVLATTHNPATLNSLTDEQLAGVVVCHWDDAVGASLLTPLTELPDYLSVIAAGRLGDAAERGVIEKAAHQPTAKEAAEAKRKSLEWVESLRNREDR